jgi:membrane fusion protein, macrolide-specific efflux system
MNKVKKRYQMSAGVGIKLCAVILATIFLSSCAAKSEKALETATVTKGSIRAQITTTGGVEPRNRLEIKPPVAGRIETVRVEEGDVVKKGQILAMMSSSDRAALLDAARAKGAAEYQKWLDVYNPAPIVAPLAGFIIQKNIEPGQTVTAADAVLVMADKLIVKAQVDETDIGNIVIGQPVNIELDAYPGQVIKGKVERIAYESQVINNVTIYQVDLLPDSVPAFFRSGMSATVNFIREEKNGVLTIPLKAIKKVGDRTYVFTPGKTSETPVSIQIKTGLENTTHVEVVSGLKEGDKLVIPTKKMITDLESKSSRDRRGPMNPFQKRN